MQRSEKNQPIVRFGMVQMPTRHGWPDHGAFGTVDGEMSRPAFSIPAAHTGLAQLVQAGSVTHDRAGEIAASFRTLKLSSTLTRWDLIMAHFGSDEKTTYRLIRQLSGAELPEEDSGPARYLTCNDGSLCGMPNCVHYGSHGRLFPANIASPVSGLIFSSACAQMNFERYLGAGAFVENERAVIMHQIDAARLTPGDKITRADKIGDSPFVHEEMATLLDHVFVERPGRGPRIRRHERHLHIYAYGDREVGAGAYSEVDLKKLLDPAQTTGLIADEDIARLKLEAQACELPEGCEEHSMYTQPDGSIRARFWLKTR